MTNRIFETSAPASSGTGTATVRNVQQFDVNYWIVRFIALVIDFIILGIISYVLFSVVLFSLFFAGAYSFWLGPGYYLVYPFIFGVLGVLYFVILEVA